MVNEEVIKILVTELTGEDVFPLVKAILSQKDVNEFKLADSLEMNINHARNLLYRLYTHNLVSFTRKKDVKKGWYIYYWTFNERRALELVRILKGKKEKEIEKYMKDKDKANTFVCLDDSTRSSFEDAMNNDFKCPNCGSLMSQEVMKDSVKELEEKINIFKNYIHEEEEKLKLAEAEKEAEAPKIKTVKKVKKKPKKQRKKKITKKKPKKLLKKAIKKHGKKIRKNNRRSVKKKRSKRK